MYLSNEETSLLTDAVKYFEVGFRSYIAETILNKYNTIDSYRNAVNGKRNSHVSSSIILNGRIKSLLDNLAQEQEIKKIYKLLSDTNTIYMYVGSSNDLFFLWKCICYQYIIDHLRIIFYFISLF